MDMDMHRATILLPEELRPNAEACARQQGISWENSSGVNLESSPNPKRRKAGAMIRYSAIIPETHPEPAKGAVEDSVANHDKYIAEALEAEVRRWK